MMAPERTPSADWLRCGWKLWEKLHWVKMNLSNVSVFIFCLLLCCQQCLIVWNLLQFSLQDNRNHPLSQTCYGSPWGTSFLKHLSFQRHFESVGCEGIFLYWQKALISFPESREERLSAVKTLNWSTFWIFLRKWTDLQHLVKPLLVHPLEKKSLMFILTMETKHLNASWVQIFFVFC